MCRVLPIASSTYYAHISIEADVNLASKRAKSDILLGDEISRVWKENHRLYGSKKVWHALRREGISIARCTVERLMKVKKLQGVTRGKAVKTTISNPFQPSPADRVKCIKHDLI